MNYKNLFEDLDGDQTKSQYSCYIRTTCLLSAKVNLKASEFCELRFMDTEKRRNLERW